MNSNEKNPVIVTEGDLLLLRELMTIKDDADEKMSFSYELSRAIVIKDDAFPAHAIKLNSKVKIMDTETEAISELIIVLPHQRDAARNKISVLSPLGTALIGFREKEKVFWKSPAGMKTIEILEVINS